MHYDAKIYILLCITQRTMIKNALILQKRELALRLQETYLSRVTKDLNLDNNLIKVITGPRRAGKSLFAVHHLHLKGNYGYVNFDDESLVTIKDYNELIEEVKTIYDHPRYLLLDEIQNLPRWELFVNRLQRQGYTIVITGSNAHLLSRELATHLTGRHTLHTIFPLSFREYLGDEKNKTTAEIKNHLSIYLTQGGYPEPFVKHIDYREYLSTLFDAIIYKDIVKRFSLRSAQAIEDLAVYLLSNIAQEYSYNTLARMTKCKSPHTVEKYLHYLGEVFLFFRLNRFSYKLKEQFSGPKKMYCIDNGFLYAKAFGISPDMGKLYENCVAILLKKLTYEEQSNLYYWQNAQQEEVDFVVKKGLHVTQLIQVCCNPQHPKTKEREIRALLKASKELRCKDLLIITDDYEAEEKEEWFGFKGKIKYIPLWKFLLQH